MIFFIKKSVSTRDSSFIFFFLGNETQQTRDGKYLKQLPFKHFLPMTLLMGSLSSQNSLKMHFCSCNSGMSLILEVGVAAATETSILILLFATQKNPWHLQFDF